MASNGEQQPSGPPEYKVYRSRKGFFSRLRNPDLSSLRDRAKPGGKKDGGPKKPPDLKVDKPKSTGWRRALKWVGIAAGAWLLISILAFMISAQLQSMKLDGAAGDALHGNPFLLASPQTILIIGTDARDPSTKGTGAPTQQCFDQQADGAAPHGSCSQGQFRADTLLLVRAGGGTFRKLSVPRDSFAEIPGQSPQKINGAFAYGGAALQIKTVEKFLGIPIDHVVILNFTGFANFIDAIGGVTVNVPNKLCADISGGAGHGQGGITLRLGKGDNDLNGTQALAYSRIREPSPCPGKGKSAFALGYDDLDRAKAQQAVLTGIKDQLTSIWNIPENFLRGPFIGWEAPQAFVSDMGALTLPQLALSSVFGGGGQTDVLCSTGPGCGPGPGGSIEVPESVRKRAVDKFING